MQDKAKGQAKGEKEREGGKSARGGWRNQPKTAFLIWKGDQKILVYLFMIKSTFPFEAKKYKHVRTQGDVYVNRFVVLCSALSFRPFVSFASSTSPPVPPFSPPLSSWVMRGAAL
jgi:hypothetical protein